MRQFSSSLHFVALLTKAFLSQYDIHIVNNYQLSCRSCRGRALTFLLDKKSKQKNQAKTNPQPGVLAGLRAVLINASGINITLALCLTFMVIIA
jgi:hypothetical protein